MLHLEESDETRRPKHRALPANVSKEEFDAHQLTHLPLRSWCDHCVRGKAVNDAHRRRIDLDQHANAVLSPPWTGGQANTLNYSNFVSTLFGMV